MAGRIYIARRSGVATVDGRRIHIAAGVTTAREGHALLDVAGSLFAPLHVHHEVDGDDCCVASAGPAVAAASIPVEQATAEPGEIRHVVIPPSEDEPEDDWEED